MIPMILQKLQRVHSRNSKGSLDHFKNLNFPLLAVTQGEIEERTAQ
jgi:hypothetical protein